MLVVTLQNTGIVRISIAILVLPENDGPVITNNLGLLSTSSFSMIFGFFSL